MRRRVLGIAMISCALATATACGQKPGVAQRDVTTPVPQPTPVPSPTPLVTPSPSPTPSVVPPTPETDDGGLSDAPSGDGYAQAPTGGNSTGVTGSTITVGLHAPVTGGAFLDGSPFRSGKDLYWRWLTRNRNGIHGRRVRVALRDDRSHPLRAEAACRRLVEKDRVFLIIGISGPDEVRECARYAARADVPYVSAGTSQSDLASLRNYFTMWMTHPQQGRLLADMLVSDLGARDTRNGIVWFNSANFVDAHNSFIDAMRRRDARVHHDRAITELRAGAIATDLERRRIRNVYVLTSARWFLDLVRAAADRNYRPRWVGVGMTMALERMAQRACKHKRSISSGRFFSPFPAVSDARSFDPDFRAAGGRGDIEWAVWGASKVVAELLRAPGRNLTRERFVYFAERQRDVRTGVLPQVDFTPRDHFAGSAMHLLRARCSPSRWVTQERFVDNF